MDSFMDNVSTSEFQGGGLSDWLRPVTNMVQSYPTTVFLMLVAMVVIIVILIVVHMSMKKEGFGIGGGLARLQESDSRGASPAWANRVDPDCSGASVTQYTEDLPWANLDSDKSASEGMSNKGGTYTDSKLVRVSAGLSN